MDNQAKLLGICADVMGVELSELSLDTTRDDLGEFDSLSIVQIFAEMEEVFGIQIPEDAMDKLKITSIRDFLQLL